MDYTKLPSSAFVIEEQLLRENLSLIKEIQDKAGVKIILAFKGFAMWSSFGMVREYITGATASSLYEAQLCFEEMKTKAHVYAPAYIPEEFHELMTYSSHIVFNSIAQFKKYYEQTLTANHKISCGLRINPEQSDVTVDLYNPSSPNSRLGILKNQMPEKLPKGIEGLHFHVLCESDSFSLEKTLQALEDKFEKYLHQIKWINMGGGHLMTRKGYDTNHLIQLLKNFKEKYQLDIILEPGSAFAWETGVLAATVLDIVQSNDVQTALLNVSFTAHMPDTLEMPYRPKIIGAESIPNNNSKFLYRLGGNSCLAGDFLEAYAFDKELQIGDRIIFKDMIHYTMVKTTFFNGIKHPDICIWTKDNQLQTIRKFNYQDYKTRLS